MKTTTILTFCDVCRKESPVEQISYPVLFTTEQNEGRGVTPYLSLEQLDMCPECKEKVIRLGGNGAQGHNNYYFLDKNKS